MSKIGRRPISIPSGVTVTVADGTVVVKGTKGELITPLVFGVNVQVTNDQILVTRRNDEKQTKANHGLIRSLLNNNVIGVTDGFKKVLKMVGTGYRVQKAGTGLKLQVGFSHDVTYSPLQDVTLDVEGNDTIIIMGINKQHVGQVAAEIHAIKPPEPYKGKGIRYQDEIIRRKQGKAAAS